MTSIMEKIRKPFFPAHLSIRASSEPINVEKLGTVEYQKAWDLQTELAKKRAENLIPDQFLVLEHPSTYTAGKRTQESDLPTNDMPVIKVNRGGRITWHGPGQLVIYPIIKLAEPLDVVDYVRRLEEALISVVRGTGIATAGRIDGQSGVWIPAHDGHADSKVAALGIRVTQGVTMHGLALNCNNTLEFYDSIVPCGISDAGQTTLSQELSRQVSVQEMISPLIDALTAALEGSLEVSNHSFART